MGSFRLMRHVNIPAGSFATHPTMRNLLRHAARPARGGALGVVLVLSALLTLASHAGFFGLPLALILFSWFFKYCFLLFDSVVQGSDDPPVLDVARLNPLDEQRPLSLLVLVSVAGAATMGVSHYLGPGAGTLLAAVFFLLLPAWIAALGVEGHLIKAANPAAWLHIAWQLRALYVVFWGVAATYALLLAALNAAGVWLILQTLLNQFAVLSLFSVLAGALYERRHELGLDVWHAPELDAERANREILKADEQTVMDAYGLARAKRHTESWAALQALLTAREHQPATYEWLSERVASWHEPRYLTRLTEERIEHLLAGKKAGAALDVTAARLQQDPSFRPRTAAATLEIARLAAQGGGRRALARALLADFATRFPGDERTATAQALAAQLTS